jgi:energy-coupling factor transport system permease protein
VAVADITIGQYLAKPTALHDVDPRLKLLAVVTGTVMIFLYPSGWSLLAFALLLLIVLAVSGVPLLKVIVSLRAVWVIVLITALLQFFLTPGRVLASWGFLTITEAGLYNGIIFSSRVVVLVILLAGLTMTTPPLKLADALESVLKPLRLLKIPIERVTTVVSITLMFIPNILEQSRKVVRAQMARGADFESANVFRRVRDVVPVLVPLFVKVFNDARLLAIAMDARAYRGGRGRTRLYPLELRFFPAVLTLLFVAVTIGLRFIF